MQQQELIKIYSENAAKALRDSIEKLTPKKKVKGEGSFEVVATTEGIDRDGEVIKVSGWNFDNYYKNPVLLWGHDYSSLPIGAVTELITEGGQVVARGVFAKSEFAQEVRSLYDDGFLKTVSVGFIPYERNGAVITKAELLELSFVSVPANPDALDRIKSFEKKFLKIEKEEIKDAQEEEKSPVAEQEIPEESKEETSTGQISESLVAEYPRSDSAEKAKIEGKAGRVLSGKNRTLVQDAKTSLQVAADALQALLDASETPEKDVQEEAFAIKKDMQTVAKITSGILSRFKGFEQKL